MLSLHHTYWWRRLGQHYLTNISVTLEVSDFCDVACIISFYIEKGGSKFLRNVGAYTQNFTALRTRSEHSW